MHLNSKEILARDKYLEMVCTNYIVNSQENRWSYVQRSHGQKAVVVIPSFRDADALLLIKEFRVPFWNWVISFPAGLLEEGEDVEKASLRELKEETGYTGKITNISMPLSSSSGLTNELFYCVEVDIQGEAGKQFLDAEEMIETVYVLKKEVLNFLKEEAQKGIIIDSKVYLYLK